MKPIESNPSLLTAILPTESMLTNLIQQPLNRNATSSRSSFHSDRYLSLSQKDINDVIDALRTLANCVEIPRHRHRDDYPSHSSNAMIHHHLSNESSRHVRTIYQSDRSDRQSTEKRRRKEIDQNQRQASIKNDEILSSIPLSSCHLDEIIYIHRDNLPLSQFRILPQQAQTIEIVQTAEPIQSLMSIDSLNLKENLTQVDASTQVENKQIDFPTCCCVETKMTPITNDDHQITCVSFEEDEDSTAIEVKRRRTTRKTNRRKQLRQRRTKKPIRSKRKFRREISSSSVELFDLDTSFFDGITVSDS